MITSYALYKRNVCFSFSEFNNLIIIARFNAKSPMKTAYK